MNIIPSVTQEEEDPTPVSLTHSKSVALCDNVTVLTIDNGNPKTSRLPKFQIRQRIPIKKAAVPSRYKSIQVRSFHKCNGQVIGHRRRVLNKKQPPEADDTMPFVDEASKLLIRSLLIQDKIDMARGKF